jgi:hypothetical protein
VVRIKLLIKETKQENERGFFETLSIFSTLSFLEEQLFVFKKGLFFRGD